MGDECEDSSESHAIGVSWWMRVSSEIRKRSRLRKDFAPYNYPPQGFPVEECPYQYDERSGGSKQRWAKWRARQK